MFGIAASGGRYLKILAKEVALGRMGGPFAVKPLLDLVVSPLGVVPKKEQQKLRLVYHLSSSKGGSVNDAIDPEACTVSYTSFDAAVIWVRCYGKGALMAKSDIESAFCLLPVHPWGAVGRTNFMSIAACPWAVLFPVLCSRHSVLLLNGWNSVIHVIYNSNEF